MIMLYFKIYIRLNYEIQYVCYGEERWISCIISGLPRFARNDIGLSRRGTKDLVFDFGIATIRSQ
ncbi:MAG: hypothetical protein P1P85_05565 [Patescibacteria group bacterium]|nr:hypothetical protein [Patescibacteria group bacterium]